MTCHLEALCVDAIDPLRLARFWAGVLGWEMAADGPKISWGGPPLTPRPGRTGSISTLRRPWTVLRKRRSIVSFPSGPPGVDIGQGEVSWVVLVDPDGHEFCVLTPR
jgi:hypothetical protein